MRLLLSNFLNAKLLNAESTEEEEFIDEEQYYNQKHILDESNLTERSFKVKIK